MWHLANATGTAGGTYWDYTDTLFVDAIHGSYGHCVDWSTGCEEGWYIPKSDVGGIVGADGDRCGEKLYDK